MADSIFFDNSSNLDEIRENVFQNAFEIELYDLVNQFMNDFDTLTQCFDDPLPANPIKILLEFCLKQYDIS